MGWMSAGVLANSWSWEDFTILSLLYRVGSMRIQKTYQLFQERGFNVKNWYILGKRKDKEETLGVTEIVTTRGSYYPGAGKRNGSDSY